MVLPPSMLLRPPLQLGKPSCFTEVNSNATSPSTCKKCGEQMLHSWDKQLDFKREMMPEEDDD